MQNSNNDTVLVTGANGFVGSRLCRWLHSEGYRVIAGVREGCDTSRLSGIDLEFRTGDITKPETLPAMVGEVDYVVHNAGVVKANHPDHFFKINQEGTGNIIEAARCNSKLKKFVYISSLAAVGPSEKNRPLDEDDPAHPITVYGRSKLAGERAVLSATEQIKSVIIRPPGIYGPGDREMFAFFQIIDNRIKPYIGSLNRRIQLVHVDDLCHGVMLALRADTEPGSRYFIAETRSYSYRELIAHLRRAVDRWCIPVYLPGAAVKFTARISETVLRLFDRTPMFTVEKAKEILENWEMCTDRARKELGFESRIPFPEGARKTVHWYREEAWL
ncbi:MAG: NAD-dependent epimerase/dehydratase family protein [Candidatus Zixiibacteriota bacterium]|nr:MAG: NAD-dependent epimerase/dehydratase family protein [candidate division Zixibacteria bacterium]